MDSEQASIVPTKKKVGKGKGKTWDEKEDTALIIEVLEREHILFGEIRGSGIKSIQRRRQDCWQEVTDVLNSRNMTVKRDSEEIKKKYQNTKQRMKDKIDRIRRVMKQTGGGPPPSYLTPAEQVFWERMCDRPAVQGITGGVDTDGKDQIEPSTSATSLQVDVLESSTHSTEPVTETSESDRHAGSKHGKKRSQHDLTMDNTMKDTERIELEKEKLAKEIEVLKVKRAKLIVETAKLKSERSTFEKKKLYYQFKIQQEFGITISDP